MEQGQLSIPVEATEVVKPGRLMYVVLLCVHHAIQVIGRDVVALT